MANRPTMCEASLRLILRFHCQLFTWPWFIYTEPWSQMHRSGDDKKPGSLEPVWKKTIMSCVCVDLKEFIDTCKEFFWMIFGAFVMYCFQELRGLSLQPGQRGPQLCALQCQRNPPGGEGQERPKTRSRQKWMRWNRATKHVYVWFYLVDIVCDSRSRAEKYLNVKIWCAVWLFKITPATCNQEDKPSETGSIEIAVPVPESFWAAWIVQYSLGTLIFLVVNRCKASCFPRFNHVGLFRRVARSMKKSLAGCFGLLWSFFWPNVWISNVVLGVHPCLLRLYMLWWKDHATTPDPTQTRLGARNNVKSFFFFFFFVKLLKSKIFEEMDGRKRYPEDFVAGAFQDFVASILWGPTISQLDALAAASRPLGLPEVSAEEEVPVAREDEAGDLRMSQINGLEPNSFK